MKKTFWRQIDWIFAAAARRPAAERAAFLDDACRGALELRREVEELLEADSCAGSFLEDPVKVAPKDWAPEDADAHGVVGPYRLVRRLGVGGMGTVYLAVRGDDLFSLQVAIKFSRRRDEGSELVARFEREREILARVRHPNVAQIFDAGTTPDGRPYLVMEYVDGLPFDRHCDEQRLTIRERAALLAKLADAVHFVHQNLTVHRDIKPDNVLVDRHGEPKLLDFGIAKLIEASPVARSWEKTSTGLRLMSYPYASPEQVRGEPVTISSDIYSLGVLCYEVLSGSSPYADDEAMPHEMARQICEDVPERMSRRCTGRAATARKRPEKCAHDRHCSTRELSRQLRGDLDTIVAKALAKEPSRRYDSARDLAADLRSFCARRPVMARPDTLTYRASRFVRRNTAMVLLSAAAALFLLAAVVSQYRQSRRVVEERDRAERVVAFLVDMFRGSNPDLPLGGTASAEEVIREAALRIDAQLDDVSEERAKLLDAVGAIHTHLGLFERAEEMIAESLALREALYGVDDPRTAESLHHLGWTTFERGDIERAEEMLRRALAVYEANPRGYGAELGSTLARLAELEWERQRYEASERLFRRSIATLERSARSDSLARAYAVRGLSRVVGFARPLEDEGLRTAEEALRLARESLGPRNPQLVSFLQNLAAAHGDREDHRAAEPILREAVSILEASLGLDHFTAPSVLSDLGITLDNLGKLREAEGLLRRALSTQRRTAATDHFTTATIMNNLARVLGVLSEFEESERLYREAMSMRVRLFGDQHPHVTQSRYSIAVLLHDAGRHEEAETLYLRAIDETRVRFPAGHPVQAYPRAAYARLLLDTGRLSQAVPLLEETLSELRSTHRPGHWRIAEVQAALARALAISGEHELALESTRESARLLLEGRGPEHLRTRQVLEQLASLEAEASKVEDEQVRGFPTQPAISGTESREL